MSYLKIITMFSSILLLTSTIIAADTEITNQDKSEIIANLTMAIKDGYVLEEKGEQFSHELMTIHEKGHFDALTNKKEFVDAVNKTLYQISHDKHLKIMPEGRRRTPRMVRRVPSSNNNSDQHAPGTMVKRSPDGASEQPAQPRMRRVPVDDDSEDLVQRNFGGRGVSSEILAGNVGLITIHDLMGSMKGIDEAMASLADTDGLIIDVRQCPGGVGFLSDRLSSYFIPEGQEIMRMHTRGQDVDISYSVELPTGATRYLNKPFYLVTSGLTGSACEALSFALKYHNKGIVLGETTAGAGHASTNGLTPVGHNLEAFIPNSRPEHPNYQGGFEKKGVSADIETNAVLAVKQAHQIILTQLVETDTPDNELTKALVNVSKEISDSLAEQVHYSRKYAHLTGTYGQGDQIVIDKGQLKLVTASGRRFPLKYIEPDTFLLVFAMGDQKLKIDRDMGGEVIGYRVSPRIGSTEWLVRKKV